MVYAVGGEGIQCVKVPDICVACVTNKLKFSILPLFLAFVPFFFYTF